jgi:hypothetical protein
MLEFATRVGKVGQDTEVPEFGVVSERNVHELN